MRRTNDGQVSVGGANTNRDRLHIYLGLARDI